MRNVARLLHHRVRFQSVLNGRIFSFVEDGNEYELVELANNDERPEVKVVLYQGNDALKLMNVIWKEVTHVS